MSDYQYQHSGGCACGAVSYQLHCNLALADLAPRACQCEFCRPRGARYISVPDGCLEVRVQDRRFLYAHAFGTFTADFMHCARCNDLVYVSCEIEGRALALAVQQSLHGEVFAAAAPADYDDESLDERLARRADNWIPELVVQEQE